MTETAEAYSNIQDGTSRENSNVIDLLFSQKATSQTLDQAPILSLEDEENIYNQFCNFFEQKKTTTLILIQKYISMYMFNWALLVQLQQDSRIIVNKQSRW